MADDMTDKQYRRTKTTSVDYTMHSSYLLCEPRPGIKLRDIPPAFSVDT